MDSTDVLHYKKLENFLNTGNGRILFGAWIVIPAKLGNQVLQLVQDAGDQPACPLYGILSTHQQ